MNGTESEGLPAADFNERLFESNDWPLCCDEWAAVELGVLLDVGYVGSHGADLVLKADLNQHQGLLRDRTGAIVAFYRIVRNGWDAGRALKEANERGMRLWYRGLRRQIEAFSPSLIRNASTSR